MLDITGGKQIEKDLSQYRKMLDQAQRLANVGSWVIDLKAGTVVWSDELYRIMGYAPDEIEPSVSSFADQVFADDFEKFIHLYLFDTDSHSGTLAEYRITTRDGSLKWVLSGTEAEYDAAGDATRVIGTVQDITARKLSEEALRESEDRFRGLFQAASEGFVLYDSSGRIIFFNPALERITGRRAVDYLGKNFADMIVECFPAEYKTPELYRYFQERIFTSFDDRDSFSGECAIVHGDGSVRTMAYNAIKFSSGQGVLYGGTMIDITENKIQKEIIEKSLEEKEVLLKEIHHRVRNNMQLISSLIDLQTNSINQPELNRLFSQLKYRVRSMAIIHEKMYKSSTLAAIDFADYAESLLQSLCIAHNNPSSVVKLNLQLQPVFLPVGKAIPLGLILNELATNTLQHGFRGRCEGEVTVALHGGDAGQVCLRVTDNGIGFSEGFDWRKAQTLGLRLVQMLIDQLHGTAEVNATGGTDIKVCFNSDEVQK